MKLTIQKFQELHKIGSMDVPEMEKSILLVRQFTGLTEQEIEKMKLKKFNRLCSRIQRAFDKYTNEMYDDKPKQYVWIGRHFFRLNYDLSEYPNNAGKYVEFATFSDDIIGNMHKIMATMCSKLVFTKRGFKWVDVDATNHRVISDIWLNANFEYAYHSCVFFYVVFNKSIQNLLTYLQSNNPEMIPDIRLIMNSTGILDGYIRANWYRNLRESV